MKRSEELEPLSHDHFEGLLVASRIRQGVEGGARLSDVAAYAAYFWKSHLSRHFEQEETVLIPILDRIERPELRDRMLLEHRRIRDLIEAARESPDGPPLIALAELMRAHIRFEERKLFPVLEEHAPGAELRAAGRHLRSAHEDVELSWEPAFWETK